MAGRTVLRRFGWVGALCGLAACSGTSSSGAGAPTDAGSADASGDSSTVSNPNDSGVGGADASTGGRDASTDGDAAEASCPPYTEEGDSIDDSSTGLTWRATRSGPEVWLTAASDCATWGGRLPTESEATSLIQAVETLSCAAQIQWPAAPPLQGVWTSTPDPQSASFYFTVFFGGGMPISVPEDDGHWVICVKGPDSAGDH